MNETYEISKKIGIWVLLFAGIFILTSWVVSHREGACAKRCLEKNYPHYEYKAFPSGGTKSIRPDSCVCNGPGGVSETFAGSSLW